MVTLLLRIPAKINNKSTSNITDSDGVIDLTTQHKHHHRLTITVTKHVINDSGGTLQASDFTINIFTCGTSGKQLIPSFPGNESGAIVVLDLAPCDTISEYVPATSTS
jgi:hypothetical protein